MTSLRDALIAALKSLLKGKSLIQAILAFWISPTPSPAPQDAQPDEASEGSPVNAETAQCNGHGHHADVPRPPSKTKPSSKTTSSRAAKETLPTKQKTTITVTTTAAAAAAAVASASPSPSPSSSSLSSKKQVSRPAEIVDTDRTDAFLREAERLLLHPVQGERLVALAHGLQAQYRDRLRTCAACMLPSYNHQLPNGRERGRYLSLDVGGSTLRVALIELRGSLSLSSSPSPSSPSNADNMGILSMESFKITPAQKQLEGMAFFDWMAARVIETVSRVQAPGDLGGDDALPMGLAWSFPIEQTSLHGGILQGMGKGFRAAETLLGRDLGDIIQTACGARGLRVALAAIVNDSTAALLSGAYAHSATRLGLILGTGVNVAVHLPVAAVGRAKFGHRPRAWFRDATHVVVNTELSMFGRGVLPVTRWDARLNAAHPRPDFQPLEHLVSGYYLGEVCRLALLDAVAVAGLFGGVAPPSLHTPYALDTETLSLIEADESTTLEAATAVFQTRHPSTAPPTLADMRVVRALASLISQRSAAIVGAAVYALWALKAETEHAAADTVASSCRAETADDADTVDTVDTVDAQAKADTDAAAAHAESALLQDRTVVAFNGSVIERYPHYRARCQSIIDDLLPHGAESVSSAPDNGHGDGRPFSGSIDLVPAGESSLLGAAVALACLGA